MKYISDTLGIKAHAEKWDGTTGLPYYLTDRYEFRKATLEGIDCLFLTPKGELDSLSAVKKHIAKVREVEPLPVVLEFGGMTAWRRRSLIGARIPFVSTDCQIYLPFLGIALAERYSAGLPQNEVLMPSSQLLLFHYLYQHEAELHTNGMADRLGLSSMQVTRAVRQLKALGLVTVHKDGVRVVIAGTENRLELFERSRQYLLNPVRRKVYVESDALPDGLPQSGLCALSELSMLNPPTVKTFAFYGKSGDLFGTDMLIDSDTQAEVELWRYAPTLLSLRPGMVDTLSLAASLQTLDDERVEQALEEALSGIWR